jgi:peptidoglycan/LPS O-acetylase OafA/YrhL
MSTGPAAKLPALTSLRFLAAAAVVAQHARETFGFAPSRWTAAGSQAVSFFFVLSGFILCHVYPALDGWAGRKRFWLARFARIYPTHLACLALFLVLVPWARSFAHARPLTLAVCVALLQSWTPSGATWRAFNSPSWSISTEAFFYACFPLVIPNWRRTWPLKLGLAFAAFAALAGLALWLGWPLVPEGGRGVSVATLSYVFPPIRVCEFLLGMVVCLAWRRLAAGRLPGPVVATALEFFAVALVILCAGRADALAAALLRRRWVPLTMTWWLYNGGATVPAFGLLIVVMALRRGWISAALARPLPVLFGEISYALYLGHWSVLRWYDAHADLFSSWPRWACAAATGAASLGLAYLMWRLVERPCRAFLVRRKADAPGAPPAPRRVAA